MKVLFKNFGLWILFFVLLPSLIFGRKDSQDVNFFYSDVSAPARFVQILGKTLLSGQE